MMCQIPQKAAIMAIPPKPLKKLKIKINPSPEFCNPTSKVIARLLAWLKPNRLPKPAPRNECFNEGDRYPVIKYYVKRISFDCFAT